MKNNYLFLFLLFISFSGLAQEELLLIKNDLKTSFSSVKQIFSAVDKSTDDFSIFLLDEEHINGYLFNGSFEKIGILQSDVLPNKYKVLLGSTVDHKKSTLYFSNRKNNKFGAYIFDFETKISEEKELVLPIESEEFLESISYKNKFYILTISKKSSIINVYIFSKDNFEKQVIDLSQIKFVNSNNSFRTLYSLTGFEDINQSISKIDTQTPVSPKFSFNTIKLYVLNNKAIITLDHAFDTSQIINIDLESFKAEVQSIKQPYIFEESAFKSSNSFLYNNTLFQFASNSDKCIFSIKDLTTKEMLTQYSIEKNNLLSIETTQENPSKKQKRKTNQFLRRNTTNNMGISVYKNDNSFEIKIGSYEYPSSGTVMMPGFGSFNMASTGNVVFSPGHPIQVFNFYGGSGIIENTLSLVFDNDLNYINGLKEFDENVFDNIDGFIESYDEFINAKTILKYKDYMILTLYHDNSNFVRLLKFTN